MADTWKRRIVNVPTAVLREDLHDPTTKRTHKCRIYAELLRRRHKKPVPAPKGWDRIPKWDAKKAP